MRIITRIRKWVSQHFDPQEKLKRIEQKKVDEMARFLSRNQLQEEKERKRGVKN